MRKLRRLRSLTKSSVSYMIKMYNENYMLKSKFNNVSAEEFARKCLHSNLKTREFFAIHNCEYFSSKKEERLVRYRIAKRKYRKQNKRK